MNSSRVIFVFLLRRRFYHRFRTRAMYNAWVQSNYYLWITTSSHIFVRRQKPCRILRWRSVFLFNFFFLIGFFSFPDVFEQYDLQQRADDEHGQNTASGASGRGPRVDGEKSHFSGTGSGADIHHVLGHVVLQNVPRVLAKVEEIRQRTSRTGKQSLIYCRLMFVCVVSHGVIDIIQRSASAEPSRAKNREWRGAPVGGGEINSVQRGWVEAAGSRVSVRSTFIPVFRRKIFTRENLTIATRPSQ